MVERLAQVARGVQHVGRHHDIEGRLDERGHAGGALDIEHLEAHSRRGKGSARRSEECRRHVGKRVMRALRKAGKHGSGGASGAGADLQDVQRPAGCAAEFRDRLADYRVHDASEEAVTVECVSQSK